MGLLVTLAALSISVFADDPGPERNSELYLRSNDQIGFSADFLKQKLTTLENLSKEPEVSDDLDEEQAKEEKDKKKAANIKKRQAILGSYCRPKEGSDQCYTRFKRASALSLIETRKSIIKNSDHAIELQYQGNTPYRQWVESDGKNPGADRKVGIPKSADPNAPAKIETPYSMYAPKHEELKKAHELKIKTQKALVTPQYLKSVEETPKEPAIEDFILRKTVKLDPRDPDDKAKTVIETGCKEGPHCKCERTFCYDKKAYDDFKRLYDSQKAEHLKELKMMTENPLKPEELPETLDSYQRGIQQESIDDYAKVRDAYKEGLTKHMNKGRTPAKDLETQNQSQIAIQPNAVQKGSDPNSEFPVQRPVGEGQGTQLYIKQNPESHSEEGVKILESLR